MRFHRLVQSDRQTDGIPVSRRRRQAGQGLLFYTLSTGVTFGMLGLVVDIGLAYWRKEACKGAAQSAVLAAAVAAKNFSSCNMGGIVCQDDSACPISPSSDSNIGTGCLYAKQNGFVSQGKQVVSMAAGSGTSPFGGVVSDYWITATVEENVPQLFSTALGAPWAKVRARSGAVVYKPPQGACVYALSPTGVGLSLSGTVDIRSTCGIYINSTDSGAFTGGGNASLTATTINVVGGYNPNGGASVTPYPHTGAAPTFDPLARVPQPEVPNRCDSNGLTENTAILMPSDGMYVVCGGFGINSNKHITLPSGTYIFTAGAIDWKNGTLDAAGPVTFFLTGTFSAININGSIKINLSSPTSGSLQGMLFFQDRYHTVGNVAFNGGADMHMNGTLYFPTSAISFSGGSSTVNNYVGIVANTTSFPGSTYISGDSTGFYTGIGLPSVGLVQ